eukprot:PhF_6_TR25327/c0_g1_i1/m.35002/K03860/PIGQ, GPI1; phosphatidylinositol glycan, class Q
MLTACKVFWPNPANPNIATVYSTTPRYVVGWNDSGAVVVVAGILQSDASIADLSQHPGLVVLGEIIMSPDSQANPKEQGSSSGSPTTTTNTGGVSPTTLPSLEGVSRSTADLWLALSVTGNDPPVVTDMYCCGYKCVPFEAQMFLYNPQTVYPPAMFGGAAQRMNSVRSIKAVGGVVSSTTTPPPSVLTSTIKSSASQCVKLMGSKKRSWFPHSMLCSYTRSSRLAQNDSQDYVWFEVVDVVLGILLASLLWKNRILYGEYIEQCSKQYLLESPSQYVEWFRGWPAGFKSNESLNKVLAHTSLLALNLYESTLGMIGTKQFGDAILAVLSVSACLGLSMFFATCADILIVVTSHLTFVHYLVAHLHCTMMYFIGSLFRVFTCKKQNPLRNYRVDAVDFQLDRLLLGTVMFTPLCFLAPTVALYFFYFTITAMLSRLLIDLFAFLASMTIHNPSLTWLRWLIRKHNHPRHIRLVSSLKNRALTIHSLSITFSEFAAEDLRILRHAVRRALSLGLWARTLKGAWDAVAKVHTPSDIS